jgi:hypothetical protein
MRSVRRDERPRDTQQSVAGQEHDLERKTMQSGVYYCECRGEWVVVFHGEDVESASTKAEAVAKLDRLELDEDQVLLNK